MNPFFTTRKSQEEQWNTSRNHDRSDWARICAEFPSWSCRQVKDLNPQRNSASLRPQGRWVDMKTTSLVRKEITRPVYTHSRLQRLFFSFVYTSQLLWSCSCSFYPCYSFLLIIKVLLFQSLFSLRHCIVQTSDLSILPSYIPFVLNSSNDCSFGILNRNLHILPLYGLVY